MSDEGRLIAGRYRLVEQIGRGGMGTVWRAGDEVLSRDVALKRLHVQRHLTDDELATLYERTRREARSAARIAHPNVVVVHDVVDDEGLPCIVMEYVPSTTLAALLKGGEAVPPGEAARIGLGMTAALRAAHAAGVLHRDVKPGNVLLGPDGRVVLTDFGIAMASGTSTLTRTGEILGSIDYIAPERMRGLKPGPAADLWALGATLFQAVEGRPPFRKDTAVETAYAVVVDPVEPMKRAGPLEPLIEALLAKDPDARPSAEETERALRAVPGEAPALFAPDRGTSATSMSAVSPAFASQPPSPTRQATSPAPVPAAGTTGVATAPVPAKAGKRGRALLWSAVAVTAAAAVVAGGVHVMSREDGGGTSGGAPGTGSATASSPVPVPAGYHLVTDKATGIAFPVPDDWKRGRSTSAQVNYADPTGLAGLTIDVVDPAGSDVLSHFLSIESNTKVNYPTYRKLRMQHTTFQGQPAAVWEFTFEGRVRVFRAIDFGFGREGDKEYDLYLSAPDKQWDTYRPVFDKVKAGFRTLR
ncbi:protein kinase [Streptomyces sp. NPDC050535]|uniref:protein kinase domain-containing protein n=1 Tax=Streptomyces sp. NPDC050535 TaxID=3365626 RepID=UPI0037BBB598